MLTTDGTSSVGGVTQGTDDVVHEAALTGVNIGRYSISTGAVDGQ